MLKGIRILTVVLVCFVLTIPDAEMAVADCSKSLQSEGSKMVQIYGQDSNLCLRVGTKGTLVVDRCEENSNGAWFMMKVRGGILKFMNAETCQVLANDDGNLGLLSSETAGTGSNTEWSVPIPDGFGKIQMEDGQKCLTAFGFSNDFGATVQLKNCSPIKNQSWMLEEIKGRKGIVEKFFNNLGLPMGTDMGPGLVENLLNALGLVKVGRGAVRDGLVLQLLKSLGL